MCIFYMSVGNPETKESVACIRIKQISAECGRYKYRRLINEAEPGEPCGPCEDYKLIEIGKPVDFDAKIQEAIEELGSDWSADTDVFAGISDVSIEIVDFNINEDVDVLSAKAAYDVEQVEIFNSFLDQDPHASALLEDVNSARVEE